ncbi:hypothetical protein MRX96_026073 [Rhipicephalus microplus]
MCWRKYTWDIRKTTAKLLSEAGAFAGRKRVRPSRHRDAVVGTATCRVLSRVAGLDHEACAARRRRSSVSSTQTRWRQPRPAAADNATAFLTHCTAFCCRGGALASQARVRGGLGLRTYGPFSTVNRSFFSIFT